MCGMICHCGQVRCCTTATTTTATATTRAELDQNPTNKGKTTTTKSKTSWCTLGKVVSGRAKVVEPVSTLP